ncbi:hypothetical protein TNCV_2372671 [Trichonephila clavipes]|nr:hypothetical protein TNCV_2372671 [Trichonephila clavipes]
MSFHNRLDDDLRWRAVGWTDGGMSQEEEARNLNVSRMVISRLWKQFKTMGIVVRRHGMDYQKLQHLRRSIFDNKCAFSLRHDS